MSSIHLLGGLPRGLFPSTAPSVTTLNRRSSFILTTWPNNPSFLVVMVSITVFFSSHPFPHFFICNMPPASWFPVSIYSISFQMPRFVFCPLFRSSMSLQHRGGLRRRTHIVAALSWLVWFLYPSRLLLGHWKLLLANCILLFISSELSLSHVSFALK